MGYSIRDIPPGVFAWQHSSFNLRGLRLTRLIGYLGWLMGLLWLTGSQPQTAN
ncbi:hypothetical protein TUM17377_26080 [Shewanella chilikensis]|nr:hypothetical protein TUM17377_26080 [Shewanella chilikensis]GHB13316.1 hypothetical protein GCM10007107_27860 [Shewanella indica]